MVKISDTKTVLLVFSSLMNYRRLAKYRLYDSNPKSMQQKIKFVTFSAFLRDMNKV